MILMRVLLDRRMSQLARLRLVPDLPTGSTTDPSVAYFKESTKTFTQLIDGVEMAITVV